MIQQWSELEVTDKVYNAQVAGEGGCMRYAARPLLSSPRGATRSTWVFRSPSVFRKGIN